MLFDINLNETWYVDANIKISIDDWFVLVMTICKMIFALSLLFLIVVFQKLTCQWWWLSLHSLCYSKGVRLLLCTLLPLCLFRLRKIYNACKGRRLGRYYFLKLIRPSSKRIKTNCLKNSRPHIRELIIFYTSTVVKGPFFVLLYKAPFLSLVLFSLE